MSGATGGDSSHAPGVGEEGGILKPYGGSTVKNDKDQGVTDAPTEFDGKGKVDTKADNERDAGASESPDKFEGSDKSANESGTEKNEQGASGAPEHYETVADFRKRVQDFLGIKINKPNDGIQK